MTILSWLGLIVFILSFWLCMYFVVVVCTYKYNYYKNHKSSLIKFEPYYCNICHHLQEYRPKDYFQEMEDICDKCVSTIEYKRLHKMIYNHTFIFELILWVMVVIGLVSVILI